MPKPSPLSPRPPPTAPTAPARSLSARLRRKLAQAVTNLTSAGPGLDYSSPPGDPGLFGPDAVCWKVHSDFTAMLAGGISALLLQALHPLALAGVWDHSTFRQDIRGRLQRTATFIAGTTFGNRADALALIERVRRIHLSVQGAAPDGRPYAASDPALLTWVHVAEVSSFLKAYLRYVDPTLPRADQDRYYAETARIAEALGAREVPHSVAAIKIYLESMRPQLSISDRALEVVRVLRDAPAPSRAAQPVGKLLFGAGVDLLPDWAQAMFRFERSARLRRGVVRPGVTVVARVMRWALTNGVSKRARARVALGGPAGREAGS
jgi:uncharacterized protein (DUF2236 family)